MWVGEDGSGDKLLIALKYVDTHKLRGQWGCHSARLPLSLLARSSVEARTLHLESSDEDDE